MRQSFFAWKRVWKMGSSVQKVNFRFLGEFFNPFKACLLSTYYCPALTNGEQNIHGSCLMELLVHLHEGVEAIFSMILQNLRIGRRLKNHFSTVFFFFPHCLICRFLQCHWILRQKKYQQFQYFSTFQTLCWISKFLGLQNPCLIPHPCRLSLDHRGPHSQLLSYIALHVIAIPSQSCWIPSHNFLVLGYSFYSSSPSTFLSQ